jgi:hypothetical protein
VIGVSETGLGESLVDTITLPVDIRIESTATHATFSFAEGGGAYQTIGTRPISYLADAELWVGFYSDDATSYPAVHLFDDVVATRGPCGSCAVLLKDELDGNGPLVVYEEGNTQAGIAAAQGHLRVEPAEDLAFGGVYQGVLTDYRGTATTLWIAHHSSDPLVFTYLSFSDTGDTNAVRAYALDDALVLELRDDVALLDEERVAFDPDADVFWRVTFSAIDGATRLHTSPDGVAFVSRAALLGVPSFVSAAQVGFGAGPVGGEVADPAASAVEFERVTVAPERCP